MHRYEMANGFSALELISISHLHTLAQKLIYFLILKMLSLVGLTQVSLFPPLT